MRSVHDCEMEITRVRNVPPVELPCFRDCCSWLSRFSLLLQLYALSATGPPNGPETFLRNTITLIFTYTPFKKRLLQRLILEDVQVRHSPFEALHKLAKTVGSTWRAIQAEWSREPESQNQYGFHIKVRGKQGYPVAYTSRREFVSLNSDVLVGVQNGEFSRSPEVWEKALLEVARIPRYRPTSRYSS